MNFEGCDVSSAAVVGARVGTGVGEKGDGIRVGAGVGHMNTEGDEVGHPVGVFIGFEGRTGLLIGEDEWSMACVGDEVGAFFDGFEVGIPVGFLVGLLVRARVGSKVGCKDGFRVGLEEGFCMGLEDGFRDGPIVGTCVLILVEGGLLQSCVGDAVGVLLAHSIDMAAVDAVDNMIAAIDK